MARALPRRTREGGAEPEPLPAGRFADAPIGAQRRPAGVRWRMMLVVFMRLSAAVWLMKGLAHWAFILGLWGGDGFTGLRLSRQGIIIAFAVLDLVAAVGLWLVSSWGAAVWWLVLLIEAALPFAVPDLERPVTDAVFATGFGVTYLLLVWRAVREESVR